mgnify:CR=1 FL=1
MFPIIVLIHIIFGDPAFTCHIDRETIQIQKRKSHTNNIGFSRMNCAR